MAAGMITCRKCAILFAQNMHRLKGLAVMDTENQIVLYRAKDGRASLEVNLRRETVWLNLQQIAKLFGRDKSVISRHIHNIHSTNELDRGATVAKIATVQTEGGRHIERQIEFYNLDMILSVGYRVNSKRGTEFRIWATQTLKDHILELAAELDPAERRATLSALPDHH